MPGRKTIICRWCHQAAEVSPQTNSGICHPCVIGPYREVKDRAHIEVKRAIYRGDLPRAKTLICVDCGKPAHDWDHRDYSKPLDVVPVCRGCNLRRGPGLPSVSTAAGRAVALADVRFSSVAQGVSCSAPSLPASAGPLSVFSS